jgi:phosphoglycolate phosphatase
MQGNQATIRHIIWDFNGTLLDDARVCVECMNELLLSRSLAPLDMPKYKQVFTFPVRDYYEALGFDFALEPFEKPAIEFIELYRSRLKDAPLHHYVTDILSRLGEQGYSQFILSAMEQDFLVETLSSKGILDYFKRVAGIRDHMGNGKLQLAFDLLHETGLQVENCLLVGDTRHDFEVATEAGISCILISNGHQSKERLEGLGCPVVPSLEEFMRWIEAGLPVI